MKTITPRLPFNVKKLISDRVTYVRLFWRKNEESLNIRIISSFPFNYKDIFQFEKNLSAYCYKRGFDGVICGHIHNPEIKEIDGIVYMNDGDFVENCTALVEHWCGRWEIITWTGEQNHEIDSNINDISAHKQP